MGTKSNTIQRIKVDFSITCLYISIMVSFFFGVFISDESVRCCGTSKAFTVAHALPVLLLLLSGGYQ